MMTRATLLLTVLSLASSVPAASFEGRWKGPDGAALPFTRDAEVLDFLRGAEVVDRREIPQGVNQPLKIRLRRSDVEAHAVFRTVDVREPRKTLNSGKQIVDFHDSHIYECAAYELSRMLGIDQVPPCVQRTLFGNRGTVQLWIEEAMTEEGRRKEDLRPPKAVAWRRQEQTLRLFDALIYNFDRNQGNMLITTWDGEWKLWLIDHTRSFARVNKPDKAMLERLQWCERGVWERLQALDRAALDERLGALVAKERLKDVLARRDVLVEHFAARIAEMGEGAVLWEAPVDSR